MSGLSMVVARELEMAATALIDEGGRALLAILPAECVQISPRQHRRYDAAVLFAERDRTRDYSEDIEARDVLIEEIGREAQWCVFDPMVSALHGARAIRSGAAADRVHQVAYFNRTLAHVTEDWACPELYYQRAGALVPNPHTPLLWTQANLRLALAALRETAG